MDNIDNIDSHDSDINWIDDFEKTDKLFKDFYIDDNYFTKLHYIYIDKNNDIEKIKEESFLMAKPNHIMRDELLKILKSNSFDNNKRYSILSILKINILIKPEEIKDFLQEKNINNYGCDFISHIKNFDTIVFEKTINMFQDLNDLIFIFYEKKNNSTNQNSKNISHNITKKISLHSSSNKKTIRKQYKDFLV